MGRSAKSLKYQFSTVLTGMCQELNPWSVDDANDELLQETA